MLGDELRKARERRGLGQREAARLAGIAPETLGKIERGPGYPTLTTLECLARALRIRVIVDSTETIIEMED
jgi:transcriptional regulator with XRE-family HTH domain